MASHCYFNLQLSITVLSCFSCLLLILICTSKNYLFVCFAHFSIGLFLLTFTVNSKELLLIIDNLLSSALNTSPKINEIIQSKS